MGSVLAFKSTDAKARRRSASSSGASAEILFFTGVRYEPRAGATPSRANAFTGETAVPPGSPPSAQPHQGV